MLKSIDNNVIGIPNENLFFSENLTPVNSKLAFNCRKLKRDAEIEKMLHDQWNGSHRKK